MLCETMLVDIDGVKVVVNVDDFDPDTMTELFESKTLLGKSETPPVDLNDVLDFPVHTSQPALKERGV